MCVAGPANFADDESRALRVATKFVNIARAHYERRGRDIDIIKLNGSIELAPILGLSAVIVDIVEPGTTLRENDLTVIEEFMPISARFIVNKACLLYTSQGLIHQTRKAHLCLWQRCAFLYLLLRDRAAAGRGLPALHLSLIHI